LEICNVSSLDNHKMCFHQDYRTVEIVAFHPDLWHQKDRNAYVNMWWWLQVLYFYQSIPFG